MTAYTLAHDIDTVIASSFSPEQRGCKARQRDNDGSCVATGSAIGCMGSPI